LKGEKVGEHRKSDKEEVDIEKKKLGGIVIDLPCG
jgi:hypothetical protein